MTEVKTEDKIATIGDLLSLVAKRAGVDPSDIECGFTGQWLDADHVLKVGTPSPFNPKYIVVALYEDETSIRLYESPSGSAEDAASLSPRRVTLTKTARTLTTAVMSTSRFIDLQAEEMSLLYDGTTTAEREREAILEHLRGMHPGTTVGTVIAAIEREDHLDGDEEEEEEAESPNGATQPPGPAAPTIAPQV